MVVSQPLLDDWLLFRAKTELPGAPARIADRQYPYGMALSVGTYSTTGAMANNAAEQGAADDLGGEREGLGEFGTLAQSCFLIHLYR